MFVSTVCCRSGCVASLVRRRYSQNRGSQEVQIMSRKLFTIVALLCVVGLLPLVGSGQVRRGQKPKVAYVTNGIASFWVIAEQGVKAGGAKYGANVTTHMPAEGAADQK